MSTSRVNIKERQRGIRERYAAEPNSTPVRLRVHGGDSDLADPLHCEVVPESVQGVAWRSGAHEAVGGEGDAPCSADLLLGALAACQEAANAGQLVLVCYAAPAPTPGHVAIVRARADGTVDVPLDGPDVIMAGAHNYVSTSMRHAFDNHPLAWPDNLALFAHETPLQLVRQDPPKS